MAPSYPVLFFAQIIGNNERCDAQDMTPVSHHTILNSKEMHSGSCSPHPHHFATHRHSHPSLARLFKMAFVRLPTLAVTVAVTILLAFPPTVAQQFAAPPRNESGLVQPSDEQVLRDLRRAKDQYKQAERDIAKEEKKPQANKALAANLQDLKAFVAAAQELVDASLDEAEKSKSAGSVPVPDPNEESLPAGSPRFKEGMFACPCSPSKGAGSLPTEFSELRNIMKPFIPFEDYAARLNSTDISRIATDMKTLLRGFKLSSKIGNTCLKEIGMEGCVNADAKLRGKADPILCSHDLETGRNLREGVTVGSCASVPRFRLRANKTTSESTETNRTSVNEGCVAIEHLDGYALQHKRHLVRPVLCYRGFCATTNHAIIVGDEYTSMGRKCAEDWQCTERVTRVNNLKVAKNRRARVSEHIVVTPYDIRFPKAAVWAVQMLEDVWNLLAVYISPGTVVGADLLLHRKMNIKE